MACLSIPLLVAEEFVDLKMFLQTPSSSPAPLSAVLVLIAANDLR